MLGSGLWDRYTLAEWWKLSEDEKIARWPAYARYVQPVAVQAVAEPTKPKKKLKKKLKKKR